MSFLDTLLNGAASGLHSVGAPNLGIIDALHGGVPTAAIHPGLLQGQSASNQGGGLSNYGSVLGASTQAQPVQQGQATGGAYGSGGASNPAAQNSYWAQQIDDQLGRLGGQENIGRQNIANAYKSAYDGVVGGENSALAKLGLSRTQTQQDLQSAEGGINDSIHNQIQGASHLLGSLGAGASSAAQILAPWAAARFGSQQRSQVQQTYGKNMAGIDQAENDTRTQFENNVGDLNNQRDTNLNSFLASLASTRANLLGQKAQLGINPAGNEAQIKSLLGQVDQLGLQPTFTPKAMTVNAPNLAQYQYDAAKAPTVGAQAQAAGVDPNLAGNTGAFWSLLGGQKKLTGQAGV